MTQMYSLYAMVFWPFIAAMSLWAYFGRQRQIARCLIVLALGQAAIDMWFATVIAGRPWTGQPWQVYLFIHAVSSFVLTIRPAGRTCSALGGLFIGGVLSALIMGAFDWSARVDLLYWKSNLVLGWLSLLIVFIGASGRGGSRVVIGAWRGLTKLAGSSRVAGVA
jgi:hypothetical protein